jgi:hypothetical protein
MGFTVPLDAEASYNKTWLTTASMLSGACVHEFLDLTEPPGGLGHQARRLHDVINSAPVFNHFRDRGYRIISIPSQVRTTDVTRNVELRDPGGITTLEASHLTTSLVGRLLPAPTLAFLTDGVRTYIERQYELLESEATPPLDQPRLVLVHLLSPHPPFVLGQDPDYLDPCFPVCGLWSTTLEDTQLTHHQYAARMRLQVGRLNEMTLTAIEGIVETNPSAVVILFSDHGARHQLDDFDEHFQVFFAARSPEHPDLLGPEASLVNVFRRLIGGYFGEALSDLPHQRYLSDWHSPLLLERFPVTRQSDDQ